MTIDSSKLDAVNTVFDRASARVFGPNADGNLASTFAWVKRNQGGSSFDLTAADLAGAELQETFGSRQYGAVREYSNSLTPKTYTANYAIDTRKLEDDESGVYAQALENFVRKSTYGLDKIATEILLSNPTGIDGVSLLNNSHAHVGASGSTDNLRTSGLTDTEFAAARRILREMKNEANESLGIRPTTLMVGPQQEEPAKVLTDSTKLVVIDKDGELRPSSNGVGVGKVRNFIGGDVEVVVNDWIGGDQWFLMDLSDPILRPMFVGLKPGYPKTTRRADPEDENVIESFEARYHVDFRSFVGGFDWHRIVGSVTA